MLDSENAGILPFAPSRVRGIPMTRAEDFSTARQLTGLLEALVRLGRPPQLFQRPTLIVPHAAVARIDL